MRLKVSPHGGYISFVASRNAPLSPTLFRVVDLGRGQPVPVSFYKVPDDFVIGAYDWDNTDKYIYVAADKFLSPESEISLARLSLETGSFLGLAKTSDIDRIEDIKYSRADNSLVILSKSFRGDYPRGEYLLKYELSTSRLYELYRAFKILGFQVTEKGQILLAEFTPMRSQGEVFPGLLFAPDTLSVPKNPEEGTRERLVSKIVLFPDGLNTGSDTLLNEQHKSGAEPLTLLNSQQRGFDFNPYLSPDGSFLIFQRSFYRLPYAVRVHIPENTPFLFIRQRKAPQNFNGEEPETKNETEAEFSALSQEFMVMQGADAYKVSIDGRFLAARYMDKSYILLFEMPPDTD